MIPQVASLLIEPLWLKAIYFFSFTFLSLSLLFFFLFKRMPFLSSTGSWLGSKTNRVFAESSQDQLGASQCSALFCLLLWLGPSSSSSNSSSVAQSCPALCNPMNHGTPDLPVHHQLLEFTQTHVHRVGDAIQPSHPLSSPSPPAPNPSQHQSLFQ